MDDKGAKAIGVLLKDIQAAAQKITPPEGVDGYVLLCTVLVFAYLDGPAAAA